MVAKIMLVLLGLVGVFLVIAALQPAEFKITRGATISAPPPVVFGRVNTLRRWDTWSPWAKLDPAMKQAYDGPAEGVGSVA